MTNIKIFQHCLETILFRQHCFGPEKRCFEVNDRERPFELENERRRRRLIRKSFGMAQGVGQGTVMWTKGGSVPGLPIVFVWVNLDKTGLVVPDRLAHGLKV